MAKVNKQINHSSKTKKNMSNKQYKSYESLIKELDVCISDKDWESAHIQEDDILKHFINEIIQNKYKTKAEIISIARMIKEKVLSKDYIKWFA